MTEEIIYKCDIYSHYTTNTLWSNVSNITDGNPETYASLEQRSIGAVSDGHPIANSDVVWVYCSNVENIDATSIIKVEVGVKGYADKYCYFPNAVVCFKNSYYRNLNIYRLKFDDTTSTIWIDITEAGGSPTIWTDQDIKDINLGVYISTIYPFIYMSFTDIKWYVDEIYYRVLYGV